MTTISRQRDAQGRFTSEGAVSVPDSAIKQLEQDFGRLEADNYRMSERLAQIDMMVDSQGWSSAFDQDQDGGIALDQIQKMSVQLRELVIANPFVKRGCQVRTAYIMGAGVYFSRATPKRRARPATPDTAKPETAKAPPRESSGLTAAIQNLMEHPRNYRYLFSSDAKEELERAAYTDGNVFVLGDSRDQTIQRVPLKEVTADLRNPDNPEEIWAYRREWNRNPQQTTPEIQVRWYYTDLHEGPKRASVLFNNKREPIDRDKVMIDQGFNRQIGWAYGVPDALAIIAWAKLYREFLVNGYIMSRALANFAFRVTAGTNRQAATAAREVSGTTERGATAVTSGDMAPMATAGKGYDFASGRPLLAAMASAIGISVSSLSGDSAGGTGAESTLDTSARSTAMRRRLSWEDFFRRIFVFMGNTRGLRVTWQDLPDEQLQRLLQAWTLVHNSGLFEGEVVRDGMAEAMNIPEPGEIPASYKVPIPGGKSALPTDGTGQGQGGSDNDGGVTGGDGSGLGNDHSTD